MGRKDSSEEVEVASNCSSSSSRRIRVSLFRLPVVLSVTLLLLLLLLALAPTLLFPTGRFRLVNGIVDIMEVIRRVEGTKPAAFVVGCVGAVVVGEVGTDADIDGDDDDGLAVFFNVDEAEGRAKVVLPGNVVGILALPPVLFGLLSLLPIEVMR